MAKQTPKLKSTSSIAKTVLIIAIILILIIAGVVAYLYYSHVFYTFKICISEEAENTFVLCGTQQQCIDHVNNQMTPEQKSQFENIPEIAQDKIEEARDKSVFCDIHCKEKTIYGEGLGGVDKVESCEPGDEEISLEIRGKEGLKLYSYLKENNLI